MIATPIGTAKNRCTVPGAWKVLRASRIASIVMLATSSAWPAERILRVAFVELGDGAIDTTGLSGGSTDVVRLN